MSSEAMPASGVSVSAGSAMTNSGGVAAAPSVVEPAKPEVLKPKEKRDRTPGVLRKPLSDYQPIYTDKPEYKEFIAETESKFAAKLTGSQRAAIESYKGNGYVTLNRQLRQDKPLSGYNQTLAKDLDSVFANQQLGKDLIVYRGFTSPTKHEVGKVYQDKGFMSTSLNPNRAFGGNTMLKIHASSKSKGAFIEPKRVYYPNAKKGTLHGLGEHEVLFARSSKYVVVKQSKINHKGTTKDLFEVVLLD